MGPAQVSCVLGGTELTVSGQPDYHNDQFSAFRHQHPARQENGISSFKVATPANANYYCTWHMHTRTLNTYSAGTSRPVDCHTIALVVKS